MRRFALLAALLLLVAGCNAPITDTSTPSPNASVTPTDASQSDETDAGQADETDTEQPDETVTETPTTTPPSSPSALADSYEIAVEGGELPFDPNLVFARTALLLDRPGAGPPERVEITPSSELRNPVLSVEFFETVRLQSPESAVIPALVPSERRIIVSEQLVTQPRFAEATFAQEAAHVIQFELGARASIQEQLVQMQPTADELYLSRSLLEGAAVYTEAAYQRKYQNASRTRIDTLRARYANATGVGRVDFGLYYFGARYVADRADRPADTWEIYENPPRTTEELLHGLPPGSEPKANLTLDPLVDGWSERNLARTTMGELFLRGLLASNLSDDTAGEAAAGWGTDRRLVYTESQADRTPGYVWIHRWDTASDAAEFEAAFATYLNRTTNRTTISVAGSRRPGWAAADRTYRLVRVAPETTAIVMGEPAFVRNVTVSGSNGSVTLSRAETVQSLASETGKQQSNTHDGWLTREHHQTPAVRPTAVE